MKPNFMAIKEKRWPEIRSWHSAVSLCVVSDNKDESPPNPRLMIVFGRNNKDLNLKDAWIYTVNSMEWALVRKHSAAWDHVYCYTQPMDYSTSLLCFP